MRLRPDQPKEAPLKEMITSAFVLIPNHINDTISTTPVQHSRFIRIDDGIERRTKGEIGVGKRERVSARRTVKESEEHSLQAMDPIESAVVDEDAELKKFNDPFEVVSEHFVRRRHAQIDNQSVTQEDEQKLLVLMESGDLEGIVVQEACARMVEMSLVSQEIVIQLQEAFEFEKVRSRRFPPFRPLLCSPSLRIATFHDISFLLSY